MEPMYLLEEKVIREVVQGHGVLRVGLVRLQQGGNASLRAVGLQEH